MGFEWVGYDKGPGMNLSGASTCTDCAPSGTRTPNPLTTSCRIGGGCSCRKVLQGAVFGGTELTDNLANDADFAHFGWVKGGLGANRRCSSADESGATAFRSM